MHFYDNFIKFDVYLFNISALKSNRKRENAFEIYFLGESRYIIILSYELNISDTNI